MVIARTGRGVWAIAGLALFGSIGCALPQGRTGGDPVLGAFNRPIAPTPSPYSGGYGGGSPAQDGGARLGLPSPDVAAPVTSLGAAGLSAKMAWAMPAPVTPANLDYSNTKPDPKKVASDKLFTPSYQRVSSVEGAKLPAGEMPVPQMPIRSVADYYPVGNATAPRSMAPVNGIIAGASLPGEMQNSTMRLVQPQADANRMQTVEDGQLILAGYGLKWHNLQQAETGDWQYSCIINADATGTAYRRYDARHANAVEAVRAVVDQARRDR